MDRISAAERSKLMSRIRSEGSRAEWAVRRMVFALGYRYRLHTRSLPGRPDLVFASRKAVIFVHGCFWHRHKGCPRARMPKSRVHYWLPKIKANVIRDARVVRELRSLGWRVLVVWECEVDRGTLGSGAGVASAVEVFLDQPQCDS